MSELTDRARYCRKWGNFDGLHGELLAEVERLTNEAHRLRYESTPERGVEDYLALRYATDPVEAFNLFIKAWVPEHFHAHLLDTDENDGEFVRGHIRAAIA